MQTCALARLSDGALLRRLARLVAHDRATTAALLASIAEVDVRRLYAPAGYSSMLAYCVGELRLSEDAAAKRIQAARAARRMPALFGALADGRLHLSAIWLLAPHLTEENASELIEAATHRRKAEIEEFLARRFSTMVLLEHAPGHVDAARTMGAGGSAEHAPGHVDGDTAARADRPIEHALGHVGACGGAAANLTDERVSLRIALSRSTREKLRYAQALLSHAVPTGDPAEVLDRALDALIHQLERRKFGAPAARPRRAERPAAERLTAARREAPRPAAGRRHVPASVRRAVWERDGGRCTFVGASGHRCESRRFLEFDHVEPVARGGIATVDRMRLRCRAHNQHEAERLFGAGFMNRKREAAKRVRDEARTREIESCLRGLGCRAEEARRAAARASLLEGATLEDSIREALRMLAPRTTRAPS